MDDVRGRQGARSVWPRRSRLLFVGLVATVALSLAAAGASARGPGPARVRRQFAAARAQGPLGRPSIVTSGTSRGLYGVTCTSAKDCSGVGFHYNSVGAELNQVLRYNGKRWSQVTVPEPAGSADDEYNVLYGNACVSASDCWAVGNYQVGTGPEFNEVLHFNGKKWSRVKAPEPGGTGAGDTDYLDDVACASAKDCWAVGSYEQSGGPYLNETLRWNGKKWSSATSPDPAGSSSPADGNFIFGDFCSSPKECWAVGDASNDDGATYTNETLRWNGKKWSVSSTPQPSPNYNYVDDVWCTSTSACWSAGGTENGVGKDVNEVLRWNGKKWSLVKTPHPGGLGKRDFLEGVACASAKECWAVGAQSNNDGSTYLNEVLRWNGKKWSLVEASNPAGTGADDWNEVDWDFCASAKRCVAVGETSTDGGTIWDNEELRWSGKGWSVR